MARLRYHFWSAGITHHGEKRYLPAVIVAPRTTVRQGDGENYEAAFSDEVHSGTEVRIIEEREAWVRLEFPNGKDGWVRTEAVEKI